MTENRSNIINIDGSEYEIASLSNEAKNAIAQLTALNGEIEALQMKFQQLDVAKNFFIEQLKNSLPETKEEEKEAAEA